MKHYSHLFSKIALCFCLFASLFVFAACDHQTLKLEPEEVEVTYTVFHLKQNISGEGYSPDVNATETLKGMTGSYTNAQPKSFEGFTAKSFEQIKLEKDGTNTVSIYYDRKEITYTFKTEAGSFADGKTEKTISGRYEAEVSVPNNPTRTGYDFTGWNETVPVTFGTADIIFTAQWKESASQGGGNEQGGNEQTEAQYTVEHWQQKTVGDEYVRIEDDTETKKGIVGDTTKAVAKSYNNFTVKDIEEKEIVADGSTVVKILYDRDIITYTFNAGKGKFEDGKNTKIISGRFGAVLLSVEEPTYEGYVFSCWDYVVPNFFETGYNHPFTANWTEESGTPAKETTYTLKYYQQKIDNDEYELFKTYPDQKAYVGAQVTDDPISFDGFTPQPVAPVTIEDGGVTVIEVYYDRNIITYTFVANGGNWNGSTANVELKGKFGATVTAPVNPSRAGYVFWKWDWDIPETFEKQNKSFSSCWVAMSGIPYTVEYWLENLNDNGYTRQDDDTEYETGTTDTDIRLEYHGFITKYSGFTRSSYTNLNINGDGSSVIKFYYDRNVVEYTFGLNGGTWPDGSNEDLIITGKYGASVNLPEDPVYISPGEYYKFDGWKFMPKQGDNGNPDDYKSTFAKDDKSFNAKWVEDLTVRTYTVKHFKQNVDNDEYTESLTETGQGILGHETAATAQSYPGFTAQNFSQETIADDDSTVVNIYYNRNNITYTFQVYGGSINGVPGNKTETLRYGVPVAKPTDPSKDHYTFINWYSDSSLKNLYDFSSTPSQNTTIYAGWKYNPIQAKQNVTIGQTSFAKTEEIYVIDPAKTGDDITVVEGKSYIYSNTNGPFKEGRTNSLSPFIMGKYEVTQELYTTVMRNQKVTVDGVEYTLDEDPFGCLETGNYQLAEGENQTLRPAENMTWYDAVYFCNELTKMIDGNDSNLAYTTIEIHTIKDGHITYATVTLDLQKSGYRLPTQTEWEFAFRGGNPYIEAWDYLFSGSPSQEGLSYTAEENTGLDSVGWYKKNSDNKTHEVGKKSPNGLGIYDMSGNVEEWCYDWQDSMKTGSYLNYTGGASSSVKIVRGGSFYNNAGVCTNYHIDTIFPETKYHYRGFRLARSVTQ